MATPISVTTIAISFSLIPLSVAASEFPLEVLLRDPDTAIVLSGVRCVRHGKKPAGCPADIRFYTSPPGDLPDFIEDFSWQYPPYAGMGVGSIVAYLPPGKLDRFSAKVGDDNDSCSIVPITIAPGSVTYVGDIHYEVGLGWAFILPIRTLEFTARDHFDETVQDLIVRYPALRAVEIDRRLMKIESCW